MYRLLTYISIEQEASMGFIFLLASFVANFSLNILVKYILIEKEKSVYDNILAN